MAGIKNTKLLQYLRSINLEQKDLFELTKTEFTEPVGMDRISNFINGKRDLYVTGLLKLCKVLQCSPNDILNWEDFVNGKQAIQE